MKRIALVLVVLVAAAGLGWAIRDRLQHRRARPPSAERGPVPVEVAPIVHGPIEDRRVFSGSLEATAEFLVAPKVGGRVVRIMVDLADTVERGQVVAELEDDEFEQAVTQAQAELEVASATEAEARSKLTIAQRALDRVLGLRERGVSSDAELDAAKAEQLAQAAALQVASARVVRATAALESARIRLGYTRVRAIWADRSERRVVAYRRVDEGETVAPNTPMLSVVELDPINAVIYVTERDYAALRPGQTAILRTDAWPDRTFEGKVSRIAPVFRETSRQARVEIAVANPDGALRPGMFVTAETILRREERAAIVPLAALVSRGGETGVFVVDSAGDRVRWRSVALGIRDRERRQVTGEGLTGRVVILGQQLLDDGARVSIPEPRP